ncbi:MAG: hypothetical protein JO307_08185 [Bryobacterales bacterium]|nr:hypothetical protein [Bryobacterales bacterium]MBV9399603.1 hypothetical protein [Bryobacterales bacterium]
MKPKSKSKSSVSPKRLAANRANAARSTGPRTPEGKARSAQNGRRHGFTASTFAIVRMESLDEIAKIRADLIEAYQPVNSQELFAIERMALAQQNMVRAARLESGLFTKCLNHGLLDEDAPNVPFAEVLFDDEQLTREQNRNFALAEGFHRMAAQSPGWALFFRYQTQAERLYRRALDEFERLKALRGEIPTEPNFAAHVEQNETTSPPPQANPPA